MRTCIRFQTIDETFEANCTSMGEESFQNPVLNPTPNNYRRWNSPNAIYPKDLRAKSQAKNIKRVLNTHYVNMSCVEDKNNLTWCNFNNYQMPFPAAQTSGSVASSGYQDTACLTGDKDPPGIFQGAWKYPGSWNFPGGLEISRT